ncbi:MAG: hypothetical protein GC154_11185 [bacterium]|nr:hypothetical protein [bacterium]
MKRSPFVIGCLLAAALFAAPDVNAQINENLDEAVPYFAGIFKHEAANIGTAWEQKDAENFAAGLLVTLDEYKAALGDENFRALSYYLPAYIKKIARRIVIIGKQPDPMYLDGYLEDFRGRVETLAKRGGPIFPDEGSRNVIKAQITELVDSVFEQLKSEEIVTSDEENELKETIVLYLYKKADDPLLSEFKRVAAPSEMERFKDEINANAGKIKLDQNARVKNPASGKREKTRKILSLVSSYVMKNWYVEPVLRPSEEAIQKFDMAIQKRKDEIMREHEERAKSNQ